MSNCVVIGSGLAGLSCGVLMAKKGYDVTVLEQANQIGGCLQCFRRADALFETGMHYVGSCEPGQTLHTFFANLGILSDVHLARLNPMGYDIVAFRGEQYPIANGREAFVDTLAQHFPHSRDQLYRYYDLNSQVANSFPIHSQNKNADINLAAHYQSKSVNAVIDSIVTAPLLRQVLVGTQPLYAGQKDHTPFTTHALITDFYDQSAFRIVGGSHHIANALARRIREYGGRVLMRQQVTRIECQPRLRHTTNQTTQQATAVVTATGDCFPADIVISTIHPAQTIRLLDQHCLRPTYRQRIASLPNTPGAFTLYLKFRKNAVSYMNHNLYYYTGDDIWDARNYTPHTWPNFLLYMHTCHQQDPVYAETGQVITYMNFDDLRPWLGTTVGRRGKAYEDFKRAKAERLIGLLEEAQPGTAAAIETYYTSTPLTYLDYTGTPEGAMYGAAKDILVPVNGTVSCKTTIPNLFLAGQSTTLHGMLGVLAGSIITCSVVQDPQTP